MHFGRFQKACPPVIHYSNLDKRSVLQVEHPTGRESEFGAQVDKTWRQVSSQKYRSILDLLGKKAMGRSMDLVACRKACRMQR